MFACFLLCVASVAASYSTTVSVIKTSQLKQPRIVAGDQHPNAVVTCTFNNTYNQTGWSTLEIHGVPGNADDEIAYYAGYIEGNQTGELIYMMYANSIKIGDILCTKESSSDFCQLTSAFIDSNLQYMTDQIESNPGSQYWHMDTHNKGHNRMNSLFKANVDFPNANARIKQVHFYLNQLQGLYDGYSSNKHLPSLSKRDFLYLQFNEDVQNLQEAFNSGSFPSYNAKIGDGRCSALVKVLAGNADLLTSHDTWSEYQLMLRIFKLYHLPYGQSIVTDTSVAGSAISMSSYPGKLQSEDDYYVINSGLVTMETTNGNNNPKLWSDLSPTSVLEPIRVMVANRLAQSGREWTEIFARYNSGTYNNQWMIVDYDMFQPNTDLPSSDLLWIVEQLPGYIVMGDETRVLINQSYWASYNIPYYSTIYEASGISAMADKYGDWFTHAGSPRAKIFARNHSDVVDMESFIKLMRYNNFKHDPLSACNCTPPYSGENAISARSDLNPSSGTYPFDALGHRIHGGIDNKATNYQMVSELSSFATCGPTHDQLPVFTWKDSGHEKPLGHVDKFDFPPVKIQWGN